MPHCLLGNSCGVVITPHTKLKLRSEANRRLHSIAIMISIVGSTKSLVGSRDEALCATVWLQNRPRGSWSPWKPPMFNLSCHSALWQPVPQQITVAALHLKALVFLRAFEDSVDCHLLSSFFYDSNLHISLFKYVLSTIGVSKESISKFSIGNWFHVN